MDSVSSELQFVVLGQALIQLGLSKGMSHLLAASSVSSSSPRKGDALALSVPCCPPRGTLTTATEGLAPMGSAIPTKPGQTKDFSSSRDNQPQSPHCALIAEQSWFL